MTRHTEKGRAVFGTQGTRDGMCGPYAFANALDCCGFDENLVKESFKLFCRWLCNRWGGECLIEGTSEKQMLPGIKHCAHNIDGLRSQLNVSFPWHRLASRPTTPEQFFEKFDQLIGSCPNNRCAIVQTRDNPDYPHWTVIKSTGRYIEFFDSSPDYRTTNLKSRTTLFSARQKTWSPGFKNLILIEKRDKQ